MKNQEGNHLKIHVLVLLIKTILLLRCEGMTNMITKTNESPIIITVGSGFIQPRKYQVSAAS